MTPWFSGKHSIHKHKFHQGVICSLIGTTLFYAAGNCWVAGVVLSSWSSVPPILAALLLIWVGGACSRYGKRLMVPLAPERLKIDKRKPVVYLRSFELDLTAIPGTVQLVASAGSPNLLATSARPEESLQLLHALGPLIAIGKPGNIPELGAYRFYVDDRDWQSSISDLLPRAQLVVLVPGSSEGILWEIRQAARVVEHKRILFYLPFVENSGGTRQQQYEQFKKAAEVHYGCRFPDAIGEALFLGFDSSSQPFLAQPEHCSQKNSLYHTTKASLIVALKRLDPTYEPPLFSPWPPFPLRAADLTNLAIAALSLAGVFYALYTKRTPPFMPIVERLIASLT